VLQQVVELAEHHNGRMATHRSSILATEDHPAGGMSVCACSCQYGVAMGGHGRSSPVRVVKVKRPAGPGWFDVRLVLEDDDGTWLHGPAGTPWSAPHDEGHLLVPVLLLLHPERPWVVWWVGDPADRRIELDVCLPPVRTAEGWQYVDLELDPVRHEQECWIEIQDEDEYLESVRQGWMTAEDAGLARRTADDGARLLRDPEQPWWSDGWRMLSSLTENGRPAPS
jgi:hypothetical protein